MQKKIWQTFLLLDAFIIGLSIAQNYENYRGSVIADPIRRALGLWGRLLDRMAQPGLPTNEQLHLQSERDYELPTLSKKFYSNSGGNEANSANSIFHGPGFTNLESLFRSDAQRAAASGGDSRSIIDERRLLELLPRVRQSDPITTTTTTTTTTTITTTIPTTTTVEEETTGNRTEAMTTITALTLVNNQSIIRNEKTTVSFDMMAKLKSKSSVNETVTDIGTTTATIRTKKKKEKKGKEGKKGKKQKPKGKKMKRKRKQKANGEQLIKEKNRMKNLYSFNTTVFGEKSNYNISSFSKEDNETNNTEHIATLRRETEELITEIENILGDEQWIINSKVTENLLIENKTKEEKPDGFNKFDKIDEIDRNNTNNEFDKIDKIVTDSDFGSKIKDNGDEIDGSGEEPTSTIMAITIANFPTTLVSSSSSGVTPKKIKTLEKTKNKDYTINGKGNEYDYEEYGEEDGDEEEYTDSYETNFNDDKKKIQKDTKETMEEKDQKKENDQKNEKEKAIRWTTSKKKNSGRHEPGIPEAEHEEDDGKGKLTLAQLDAGTSAVVFGTGGGAANSASAGLLGSNFANAIDPAAVIVPVRYANSIIDGIGPLILPLLGYSGQQASNALGRAKAAGAPTLGNNAQQTYDRLNALPQKYQPYETITQQQASNIIQEYRNQTSQSVSEKQDIQFMKRQYASPTVVKYPIQRNGGILMQNVGNHWNSTDVQMLAQELDSTHFRQVMSAPPDLNMGPSVQRRVVNAETDPKTGLIHGLRARFMPDPPSIARIPQPTPTIFTSDAIRQALSNILQQPRIAPPTTQGIAESALRQVSRYDNEQTKKSQRENAPPTESGNEIGRRNVENNFYEDSGVILNSGDSFASPPGSFGPGSSGFSNGRKPSLPLDDSRPFVIA